MKQPLIRAFGVIAATVALVSGVTFAAPQSQQIKLIGNTIQTAKTLTTQGDALNQPDPPVAYARLLGKVVAVAPRLGTVLDFVKQPLGMLLSVYLPATALIISEVLNLVRFYRQPLYRLAGYRKC